MSEPIDGVSPVSETRESQNTSSLYRSLELEDVKQTNLNREINQTYQSTMESLAESTGDSSIAHSNTVPNF
ncbi:MAG: hypothetical protein KDK76_03140 [Chlamydiia bacterium]|nr:hypothetical protein [Chlamydiia bacterium]